MSSFPEENYAIQIASNDDIKDTKEEICIDVFSLQVSSDHCNCHFILTDLLHPNSSDHVVIMDTPPLLPILFGSLPLHPHHSYQPIIQFQSSPSFVVSSAAFNGETNGCIIEGVLIDDEIVVNALR